MDNAKISYDLNMTTMNMGTQHGDAVSHGNGQYFGAGRFSMRGPWGIRATIIMPNGQVINKDFMVNVY